MNFTSIYVTNHIQIIYIYNTVRLITVISASTKGKFNVSKQKELMSIY